MQKTVREFNISNLLPIGLTFVVLGVAIAYGLNVLGDVQSDMVTNTAGCNSTVTTACGAEYNATSDAISGVAKIASKMPLIVTVVLAAVIIGILVTYMVIRNR